MDFPLPVAPQRTTNSPESTQKLTSLTAERSHSGYVKLKFLTASISI